MENRKLNKWLNVFAALLVMVPTGIVIQQSMTSLVEQGAASGNQMTNAALYPQIIAGLLVLMAISQIIISWRSPTGGADSESAGSVGTDDGPSLPINRIKSLVILALLAGYILALPTVGYHIATPVLAAISMAILDIRPIVAIAMGLAMSIVIALFFEVALNVVLPVGVFEITLPF